MTSTEVVPATAEQARDLTDRIKIAVDGTWQLVKQAYMSRAWAALGYSSWDDYCTREFGTSRLRLPREERQEVVASLRDTGMSVRAIASATGYGRDTVARELSTVRNRTVEPDAEPESQVVTGVNGKTYAPPSPKGPQKPRTDVVATVNRALQRAQDSATAADEVTKQHLVGRKEEAATWGRSLSKSVQSLQRLLHDIEEIQQ